MKPNDIDAIISSKLQENYDLYQDDMNASKPFIWGEVRSKINSPKSITWYHLAAAVILLFMVVGFVFHSLNQQHQSEITNLMEQVNQLQKANHAQSNSIMSKDNQIMAMQNEMEVFTTELSDMSDGQKPASTLLLHKTDTVYITVPKATNIDAKSIDSGTHYNPQAFLKPVLKEEVAKTDIDEVIFPDYSTEANKPAVETPIKVRFGTFTAKKD